MNVPEYDREALVEKVSSTLIATLSYQRVSELRFVLPNDVHIDSEKTLVVNLVISRLRAVYEGASFGWSLSRMSDERPYVVELHTSLPLNENKPDDDSGDFGVSPSPETPRSPQSPNRNAYRPPVTDYPLVA